MTPGPITRAASLVLLATLASCSASPPAAEPPPDRPTSSRLDAAQARLMLDYLRAVAAGRATRAQLDALMASPGTALIVAQQNLSRRVKPAQVRALLAHLDREETPDVVPAGPGERARRGADGLRNDVWPALRWGVAHAELLAQRLAALERLDVAAAAHRLAASMLPRGRAVPARLHLVMGGRAGAAAIGAADIYVDVLATSFHAQAGRITYPTAQEFTEYFAHEVHHLGMQPVLARTLADLSLSASEGRAFELLSSMALEGSATYLINEHRDLDAMRRDPMFAPFLADPDKLVARCEQLLDAILDDGLAGEAYEQAVTPLVGSGFHAAGALLLDAIWRAGGKDAVMAAIGDPRRLLADYNAAAARLREKPPRRRIDATLAARAAVMGERVKTGRP
jgi:Putative zinc dependent peptidase (DUF5700)